MLQSVEVGKRSIKSYEKIVGKETIEELHDLAKNLKGLKLIQISATTYGGGVSEMLRSLVPLERDLGIDAEWRVITGDNRFFRVTKQFHNALQGEEYKLTAEDKEIYLSYNLRNAHLIDEDYDVFIIHDPQPAAIRHFKKNHNSKWVWRCHIDTSEPNEEVWNFLKPFIESYDKTIFTMDEFAPSNLKDHRKVIIAPAIDPLSPKNIYLPNKLAKNILSWIGIPQDSHLIVQVSRFDPWKDPLGVINVYRLVKKEVPNIRLALIGSMALDDPQGWDMYSQIMKEDAKDPNLFVFTNLTGVSNIEVNAFQRIADVVIQKSIREGFGLVISEALYKKTPVVAGRAGGIPLQIDEGGFLVNSIEECAERITYLIKNPEIAEQMGAAGSNHIKENFLLPRLIKDELLLLNNIVNASG